MASQPNEENGLLRRVREELDGFEGREDDLMKEAPLNHGNKSTDPYTAPEQATTTEMQMKRELLRYYWLRKDGRIPEMPLSKWPGEPVPYAEVGVAMEFGHVHWDGEVSDSSSEPRSVLP